MINRKNKKNRDEYLKYLLERLGQDELSINTKRSRLNHLLIWCDETKFEFIPKRQEIFRQYVDELIKPNGKPQAPGYKRDLMQEAKRIFEWLAVHKGYRSVTPAWLDTFTYKIKSNERNHLKSVAEQEIKFMANLPTKTLREQRARASALFLYATGARASAFATLPIKAVNLKNLEIYQWTSLGVRTKNRKSATTFILNIGTILDIIKEWDKLVRLRLPPEAPWFAPISSTSLDFDTHKTTIGKHRARAVNKDLEIFGMRNGFQDFFTPHDFRRGHANFLFGRAIDMADLIAAQNNLMHTSLTTTEMYARQRQEQTRKRISIMSGRDTSIHSKEDLSSQMLLEEIIKIKQILKKER